MADSEIQKSQILVVDDEKDHAQVMCEALMRQGHKCDATYSLREALDRLDRRPYDVIVTDLVMEGNRDGLEVLKKAQGMDPPPPVVLVTAHGDIPTAVQAMNQGAYSFIEKPLDLEHFRAQVNRAAERASLQKQNQVLQEQIEDAAGFEGIVGNSPATQQVMRIARQVAPTDIPVLILGENGTGKELVARASHNHSKRRKNRLVILNCAGFAPTILEDELFGHVKGAYTGANADREGRFERAAVGMLEAALAVGVGAGVRAFHMAEQFVFQNGGREAGAVQDHQPVLAAFAVIMNGAGDQLLAGTVLAQDEHGNIGWRDLPGDAHHLLRRGAVADDALETGGILDLLLKHLVLLLQRRPLGGAVHLGPKMLQIQRLFDKAVSPLVHRLHGCRDIPMSRYQHHRRRRVHALRLLQHLQ